MEIRRLELHRFGVFPQQVIELAGRGKLNLIYGPNEAGKSTARRAVLKFLFGFQTRDDPDTSVFGRQKAAVVVHLVDGSGREWHLRRTASRREPEPIGTTDPFTTDDLARLLHHLSKEDYEHIFCLDHTILRQGGAEIGRAKGRTGPVLLGAAAGLLHVEEIRQKLMAELDALFKPRARNPKINKLLGEIAERKREARRAQLDFKVWTEARQRVEKQKDVVEQLRARRGALQQQLDKARAERLLLDLAQRYRDLQRKFDQLAGVPTASETLCNRLRQLCVDRKRLQERIDTLREQFLVHKSQLQELENRLSASPLRRSLAGVPTDELEPLISRATVAAGLAKSLPATAQRLRGIARELRADLQQLGVKPIPFRRALAYLEELARQWPEDTATKYAPVQAVIAARQRHEQAKRRQEQLEQRLAACGSALDPKAVQHRRRQLSNALVRLDEVWQQLEQVQQHRRKLAAVLARLELPEETNAEQIVGLPVHVQRRIEQLHDRLGSLRRKKAEINDQLSRLDQELKGPEREIVRLRGSQGMVTRDVLLEERANRDELLRRLDRALTPPQAGEASANRLSEQLDAARELLAKLKQQVAKVDLLSDGLCEAIRAAERLAAADRRYQEIAAEIERQHKELNACETEAREIIDEWCRLTRETIIPESVQLDEADAWLRTFTEALRQAESLQDAQARLSETVARLTPALQELEVAFDGPESFESLARLRTDLEAMDRDLEKHEERAARHERIRLELEAANRELAAAEAERARAEADYRRLVQELQRLLEPLGAAEPEDPAAVAAVLGVLQRLVRRWEVWKRSYDDFRPEARTLKEFWLEVDRIGGPGGLGQYLGRGKLTSRLDTLQSACKEVARLRAEQQERRKAAAELAATLDEAGRALERIDGVLTEHAAKLGLAGAKELVEALEAIIQKSQLQAELDALASQIEELAPAQDAASLVAELATRDKAELDAEMEQLAHELQRLEQEIYEAQAELTRAEEQFRALEQAGDQAAAIAQQAEGALAEALDAAHEYIVMRAALTLFDRLVDKYRERADAQFWRNASEFFREMTCGSYTRVEPDGEALVALRASEAPEDRVGVEELSDGTRDQLFLALRLAAIRNFVRERGPVPVLLDDLLVNFDDRRAARTLELLANVALETQVIFFTHHEHLLELAERTIRADQVHVTCLDVPTREAGGRAGKPRRKTERRSGRRRRTRVAQS